MGLEPEPGIELWAVPESELELWLSPPLLFLSAAQATITNVLKELLLFLQFNHAFLSKSPLNPRLSRLGNLLFTTALKSVVTLKLKECILSFFFYLFPASFGSFFRQTFDSPGFEFLLWGWNLCSAACVITKMGIRYLGSGPNPKKTKKTSFLFFHKLLHLYQSYFKLSKIFF